VTPILPRIATLPWRKYWYSSRHWRRRRAHQLLCEPLCKMCLARGVTTPATIADHVVSHGGDWNAFILGELQSLCEPCHNSLKRRLDQDGFVSDVDDDGWPIDPRHPANAR
jgi:5-methylcytosine-specific restriction endonuclease McrA